ncbi:hypothetical protein FGO68_gene1224 [Halteria grandinella]|uniref:Uncharacterized protein n=1 Tax=Halteria grandinella TaxID=5974 RepID=A0A8J8NU11_HALGN|nr:hypothetical protein FGO68_gene1224 [Halteria grandinella]
MEQAGRVTVANSAANEKLKLCTCGSDKALFYCERRCNNQSFFCINCANDHDHGAKAIQNLINESNKEWTKEFEQIETLYRNSTDERESNIELIEFCEKTAKCNLLTNRWMDIKKLFDDVQERFRPIVENSISQYDIETLDEFKQNNLKIIQQRYGQLCNFPSLEAQIQEFYPQVFTSQQDTHMLKSLSSQSLKQISDMTKKVLNRSLEYEESKTACLLSNAVHQIGVSHEKLDEQREKLEGQCEKLDGQCEKLEKQFIQFEKQTNLQLEIVARDQARATQEIQRKLETQSTLLLEELRRMMENQKTQMKKEIFDKFNLMDARLSKIEQNAILFNKTYNLGGHEWVLLFGVNSSDIHDYNSSFWTSDDIINPTFHFQGIGTTFKQLEFSKKPVKHLYIQAQNGNYSELELPETMPLKNFFARAQVTNLVWKSGAKDPLELITGVKDSKVSKPEWRINSCSNLYPFRLRFGGFQLNNWGDNYGVDALGQKCTAECAGFGITDQEYPPFVNANKSFGVRWAHDKPGTGALTDKAQMKMGAVVYGRA